MLDNQSQIILQDERAGNISARKVFEHGVARRCIDKKTLKSVVWEKLYDIPDAPLVIKPAASFIDVQDWARSNRLVIDKLLVEHGALLFRGFSLATVEGVSSFSKLVMDSVFKENTEHRRIDSVGDVQIPVEYTKSEFLLWHNENTFNLRWPNKAIFACALPAVRGGQTPLVDSRSIYQQMDPGIRQQFVDKKVMYVRNYGPDDRIGLGWKTIFGTDSKAIVEALCKEQKMDFEWGSGDRLSTFAVRPAVWQHPISGEWSWFNQAQHWHFSCLDNNTRTALQQLYSDEKNYPRNCFFGDGSPIADEIMSAILDLYRQNHVEFDWQQGDLLLVDNILKAHARNPFEGERRILVCFGDMGSF
uniref:SyrP-like protein n=1 Tax=Rheinheimera sp. BAL341 TaxID=1708203 RepID=A0A486XVV8_9GAMM